MKKNNIQAFVEWARAHLDSLRNSPSEYVANLVFAELEKVAPELGVEVGDSSSDRRELILTAFSDPDFFQLVKEIADQINPINGWSVVPLKPPRGFKFNIALGRRKITANSLKFEELPGVHLGIRIICPMGLLKDLNTGQREELGWLIVESGVGEELSAMIQHIEFVEKDGVEYGVSLDLLESKLLGKRL